MVHPPSSPSVVLLSEDHNMCSQLKKRGVATETVRRAERDPSFPIKILPARYLTKLYQELGMYIHTAVPHMSIPPLSLCVRSE